MEHLSLYIYFYSIYSNITIAIGLVTVVTTIVGLATAVAIWIEEIPGQAVRKFRNTTLMIAVVFSILAIITPKKDQLLLIFAADPVANTIIDSYQNGKLKKVEQILDLSLDKALKTLQEK